MAISPTAAAGAYARVASSASGAAAGTTGSSFADLVRGGITGAIDASRASEAATAEAISGKGDLTSVVAAVTNAELTLEAVVAVRDRVIGAYQEIVKMPI